MGDLEIAIPVLSLFAIANAWLFRRFRRAAAHVSCACHLSAALAITLGALTAVTGVGHSVAVASLALREPEYGVLQVLRFTTGAMLIYAGGMSAALYGGIKVGRHSAIALAAASASLFVLYLFLLLPVGGGDTVPPMLALWSMYLVSLIVGLVAVIKGTPPSFGFRRVKATP